MRTRRFPTDPLGLALLLDGSAVGAVAAAALIERRRYAKSSLSPRLVEECGRASDGKSSWNEPTCIGLSSSIVVAKCVEPDTGAMAGLVGAYAGA